MVGRHTPVAEVARRNTETADAGADRLAAALDALAGLDASSLARRWRQSFGSAAPPGLSPALRVRILAHRLQARTLGDLDRDTARALDRLAAGRGSDDAGGGQEKAPGRGRPKLAAVVAAAAVAVPIPDRRGRTPGVQLAREWGGRMHTVTVLEVGYAFGGATYPSLSRVAHAITGTRWNGPRFFGLRETGTAKAPAAAQAMAAANAAAASGGQA